MKNSLSDSEIDDIFSIEIWKRALDKQRLHVDCCLCQKSTQLLARNQKLLLLDLVYFKTFSKDFEQFVPLCLSIKRRRYLKACAYELCHQYFYISRKIDYLPCHVTQILELVVTSFNSFSVQLTENMSKRGQGTLYYVAGWTLHAIEK